MKKLYLIRHAESEGNISPLRQSDDSPLSTSGLKQAELVAERFKNIEIEKIISSPHIRTKQTAETIASATNRPLQFSDLLIERRHPSILKGQPKISPEVDDILKKLKDNFHIADWHYSDEENFEDLKKRALEVLEYAEKLEENNILMVTHGIFLRMIIACVMLGAGLTSREYWEMYVVLETQNTGITLIEQRRYRDEKPRWHLVTWNDHAHLGEIKK